jgi:hypothetical protein
MISLLHDANLPSRRRRCGVAIAQAVRNLGLESASVCTLVRSSSRAMTSGSSRVAALAGPSEVIVSSTVKDLVTGSGLTFEDAGDTS